ncbi:MAG: hypothetical protein MZW92_13090 [Comamonadaceae bacterium]|nr:hypothetical protein [Comamonadaceae bacterium]
MPWQRRAARRRAEPDRLPWRSWAPAPPLEREGVTFRLDGHVDMERHQWTPHAARFR